MVVFQSDLVYIFFSFVNLSLYGFLVSITKFSLYQIFFNFFVKVAIYLSSYFMFFYSFSLYKIYIGFFVKFFLILFTFFFNLSIVKICLIFFHLCFIVKLYLLTFVKDLVIISFFLYLYKMVFLLFPKILIHLSLLLMSILFTYWKFILFNFFFFFLSIYSYILYNKIDFLNYIFQLRKNFVDRIFFEDLYINIIFYIDRFKLFNYKVYIELYNLVFGKQKSSLIKKKKKVSKYVLLFIYDRFVYVYYFFIVHLLKLYKLYLHDFVLFDLSYSFFIKKVNIKANLYLYDYMHVGSLYFNEKFKDIRLVLPKFNLNFLFLNKKYIYLYDNYILKKYFDNFFIELVAFMLFSGSDINLELMQQKNILKFLVTVFDVDFVKLYNYFYSYERVSYDYFKGYKVHHDYGLSGSLVKNVTNISIVGDLSNKNKSVVDFNAMDINLLTKKLSVIKVNPVLQYLYGDFFFKKKDYLLFYNTEFFNYYSLILLKKVYSVDFFIKNIFYELLLVNDESTTVTNLVGVDLNKSFIFDKKAKKLNKVPNYNSLNYLYFDEAHLYSDVIRTYIKVLQSYSKKFHKYEKKELISLLGVSLLDLDKRFREDVLSESLVFYKNIRNFYTKNTRLFKCIDTHKGLGYVDKVNFYLYPEVEEVAEKNLYASFKSYYKNKKQLNVGNKTKGFFVDKIIDFFDYDYFLYGIPDKFYFYFLDYYFDFFPDGLYPRTFFDSMIFQLKESNEEKVFSKFFINKRKFNRLNILYRFDDSFYDDYTFYWWNLIHVNRKYKIQVDEIDKPEPDPYNVFGGESEDIDNYLDAKAELHLLKLESVAFDEEAYEEGTQLTFFTEELDDFLETTRINEQIKTEFMEDDQDTSIFELDLYYTNNAAWSENFVQKNFIILTREEEVYRTDEDESFFKDCELPSSILNRSIKHSNVFNSLLSKRIDFKQDRVSWFLIDADDNSLTDEYLKTQRFFIYDYLNLYEFVFNVQFDEYKKKFINLYSIQFLFDVILYYTYNRTTRLYNTTDEIYFDILNKFNTESSSLWDMYFFMLYNEPYDLKYVKSNFVFNKYKSLFLSYNFKNKSFKYKTKGHFNNSFSLSDYAWYNNTDILIGSDNFEVDNFDNRYLSFEELMSRDNFFNKIVSGPKRDAFLENFFNSIDKYYNNNSVTYHDELLMSFEDIPSILDSYDEMIGHWYYADGEKFANNRDQNFNDETQGFFEAEYKPYYTDLQVRTFTFEWNNGYDLTQGFVHDDYLEIAMKDPLIPVTGRMHKVGEDFYRHQYNRSDYRNVVGGGLTYGFLDMEKYVVGDFNDLITEHLVEEEDMFFSVHGLSSSSSYNMLNQHIMNVFKYSGLIYNYDYKQLDFFMLNIFFDYYVYTIKASSLNYILKTEYKLLLPKYYCFGPFGEDFELNSNLFLYSNKRHQVSSTGLKKIWYYIALLKEFFWCKFSLYGFWVFDFLYYGLDSDLNNVYIDFDLLNFRFYYGYYLHAFYMFFYIIYRYFSSVKSIFANIESEEDYGEWATGLIMYNYFLQVYEDLGLVFNISDQFVLRTQDLTLTMHDTERGWWNGSTNLHDIVQNEMDDYMGFTDEDFEVSSSVLKSFGVNGYLADMDNRYFMQRGNFSFLYFFSPNASLFVEACFYLYFLKDLIVVLFVRFLDYLFTDFFSFIILNIKYIFNLFLIGIEFLLFIFCSFVLYLKVLIINWLWYGYKIWNFFSENLILLFEKLLIFEFLFYILQLWLLPFELGRVVCIYIYNNTYCVSQYVACYIDVNKLVHKFNYIFYIIVKCILLLVLKFFALYILLVLLFDYYDWIVVFFESILPIHIDYRTTFFVYIILIFLNLVFLLYPLKLSKWLWSTRYLFLLLVIVLWVYSGLVNSPQILFSQVWDLLNLKTNVVFGELFFAKTLYPFTFEWIYNHYFRVFGLFTGFDLPNTHAIVDKYFLNHNRSPFLVLAKILYYDLVAVEHIIGGFFSDIKFVYYKLYKMLQNHDLFRLTMRFIKIYYRHFRSIFYGNEENILLYYIYIYPRYMSFFDYFYNIFSIQVNISLTRYHFARMFYENFGVAPFGSLYLLLVHDVSNKLALSYYRNVFSLLRKDLWGNYRVDLNNVFMFYERGALSSDYVAGMYEFQEIEALEHDAQQYGLQWQVDLLGNYAFTTTIKPDIYIPNEAEAYKGENLLPYVDFGHLDENYFLEEKKRKRIYKRVYAHHLERVNLERLKYRRASEVLERRRIDLIVKNRKLSKDLGTTTTSNFWKTKSSLNKQIEANELQLKQCKKYINLYKYETGESSFNKERVKDVGRKFPIYLEKEHLTGNVMTINASSDPFLRGQKIVDSVIELIVLDPKKYEEAPVILTNKEKAFLKRKSRLDAYYFTRYTGNQYYYRKYRMIYDLYDEAYLYFPYTAAGVFKSDNSTFSVRYPNNRFILDDDAWREEESEYAGGHDTEYPNGSAYNLLDGRSYYFRYLVPDLGFIGSTHWGSHWQYLHMDTSNEDLDYLFFKGSARSPMHTETMFVR